GFDVTERLTSIARANLDAIERRIQSSLPPVKPWAERVWELLHNPVFLDKDHCLRLEPQRFLQSPAQETAEGYRLGVGLELRFVLSDECKETAERRPLAPLATVDRLDGPSRALLLQSLDLESMTAQLNRSSRGKFGFGENLERISVSTAKLGDAS